MPKLPVVNDKQLIKALEKGKRCFVSRNATNGARPQASVKPPRFPSLGQLSRNFAVPMNRESHTK